MAIKRDLIVWCDGKGVDMTYKKEDLVREFEFEHNRCQFYIDSMYKILQFTFAAIIALIVFGLGAIGGDNDDIVFLLFALVLPMCIYVFGIFYAYDAYALAVCGERAEIIHKSLYYELEQGESHELVTNEEKILAQYVVTKRPLSLISYGVALGCFIVTPIASIWFGYHHPIEVSYGWAIRVILPNVAFVTYAVLMLILILFIVKPHFSIKKIQRSSSRTLHNMSPQKATKQS